MYYPSILLNLSPWDHTFTWIFRDSFKTVNHKNLNDIKNEVFLKHPDCENIRLCKFISTISFFEEDIGKCTAPALLIH